MKKKKGGEALDLSTDAVCCAFQGEEFPFELIDGINLKGYTYDDDGKSPKYKLESKGRLKVEKMKRYRRSGIYKHEDLKWDIKDDPRTNDFKTLAQEIIDSKKSIHIDGRAGCGKSTLIRELQKII